MSKSIVSLCLLRIIYPLCFTICVTCRQDLITAVFLMFLMYIPFVPLPTPNTMNGTTGFFLKLSFAMSVVMSTLQVAFQIVLLSMSGTYGSILLGKCNNLERLFRHIGFIRYDNLPLWDAIIHIAPEVIALFTSFFAYVLCDRLNPRDPDAQLIQEQGILMTMMQSPESGPNARQLQMKKKALIALTIIGKYLSLAMLCFTSILVPSVSSGVLFAVFLCCITYWACYKDLGKGFAILCRFLCVGLFVYIVAIFCYQTEIAQKWLEPNGKIARFFGLQALRLTNCETDSRFVIWNVMTWRSFVLPFALLVLYNLLILESRILLVISEVRRALFEDSEERVENPNESTPLIRGRESIYRKSGNSTISQDSHGSVTITHAADEKSPKEYEEFPEGEESLKVDVLEYLMDAFITVVSFITRTSYIGTNIIMMTWSITYHSFFTFFLLLGAIILWMVPNQRQSMLRVSPFLIVYAELLLISQYVLEFDLLPGELPTIKIPWLDWEGPQLEKNKFNSLAIKTLFTTMFWITMRQYMRERQESRSTSTVAHMMAPVHVTVGTATAMGGDPSSKGGQIMQKFGERIRLLLTKFWIWVVTITLFAIGIIGNEMTLFRIIYTALALLFVIVFQLSWTLWRKMMYGFWLTVIIISMVILVMIYTFQFNLVRNLWERIGVGPEWQRYIGLEKGTGDLFLILITPTFFVIITVIQLKYFHKDFLLMSDIKSRGTSTTRPKSRPSILSDDEYGTQIEDVSSQTEGGPSHAEDVQTPGSSKTLVDDDNQLDPQHSRPSFHVFGHTPNVKTLQKLDLISFYWEQFTELFWLFMELHVKKLVLLFIVQVSLTEVSVIHLCFLVGSIFALMLNSKFQDILIRLMSVSAAVVLLAEMIFQIEHFDVSQWSSTCFKPNTSSNDSISFTVNATDWLGFHKQSVTRPMIYLLAGYIYIIMAVTFYVVVITKQKYVRHLRGRPLSRSRVLFPRISFRDVDRDLLSCVKYLFNYGFYRFGVELTFIFIIILIGFRLDVIAMIYAVWLLLLNCFSRPLLSRVWYPFNLFIAITTPLQYAIIVGLPPQFCFAPFEPGRNQILTSWLKWLFLPVYDDKPDVSKLIWDFLVLLLVTRQTKVFRIEWQHQNVNDYSGGSNKSIINEVESPNYANPTPDFISDKNSYLDILKHGLFCSLLWVSCAVIFVAGTSSVTVFSFVYVISSFLILWQGNDFYLRPMGTILKWWNRIITYNVFVITCKILLQIPGCIYYAQVTKHACWLAQLLGIVCMDSFSLTSAPLTVIRSATNECRIDGSDSGMASGGLGVDAICFICLIMQKRLLSSHYFVRIVDDAKAMAVLAARGAELIEELSKKQIQKQQEVEKAVLQKIKNKMDSIKAAQKKIQGHKEKEITSHYEAIRSGDYYMFDECDTTPVLIPEDELDAVDELEEEYQGKTVGKLMESVMKTDMKHAIKQKSSDESKSTASKSRHSETLSKMSISSTDDVEDDEDDDDKDCSTCQFKSTDATTSKDVTESLDDSSISLRPTVPKRTSFKTEKRKRARAGDDGDADHPDHSDDHSTDSDQSTLVTSVTDEPPLAKCFDTFVMYLKFAVAFINSCMISVTLFLNRKSKDYRYVIQALEKEKKHLKETRNLRVGMRIRPDMKWQPIPSSLVSHRSKSPMKMEEFESQGLVASTQPVFIRLLLAIYHAIMSHSDLVCYVAVFMLQIRNPTLASLPLTLMVFLWGTLSIPRPTKRFWVTIIAYTEFIIVIKSMCQSEVMPIDRLTDDKPFHWQRILGIEKDPSNGMYDLILLLAVFFHRSTLKSLGLWKSAEEFNKDNQATNLLNLNYVEPRRNSPASESVSEGVTELTTVNLVLPEQGQGDELAGQSTDSYQNQIVPQMKINSRSLSASDENMSLPFFKSIHDFFNKLLNSKNRLADDVYAFMFMGDFCNIIVIIFGYSSFGESRGDGGVTQYIENNKIPITFLLMVILQFALIVVDRWLYLSRYIFGKLVFQFVLVIGIHIWMFFILPAVTERKFDEAFAPSLWYFIKCIYLLLSAYQIRSSYPSRILGNFLCKNYNIVNMMLFKCFMYTPFVYELRTLMDWIWTETSMTLTDWIKMEDIFAQIFLLKCVRKAENKYLLPRGQKIAAKTKTIYGGGGLIALFTVIWFPLVLFALGDTVGEPYRPTDMSAKVQISSYQAIYASSTSKIYGLTEDQWEKIKKVYSTNSRAQTFLSDYKPEDVGVVFLPHYSGSVWTIPPPEESDLVQDLKNKTKCAALKVSMEYTFNRNSQNPESPKTVSGTNTIEMDEDTCNQTVLSISNSSVVTMRTLMPKFLKITNQEATPVSKLMRNDNMISDTVNFVDLSFKLEKDKDKTSMWWSAIENVTANDLRFLEDIDAIASNDSSSESLIIFTFNDKTFPPGVLSWISGKGIVGLYTTFVIVVGWSMKSSLTNTSSKTMFEDMPYVDRILQLCLDIFLVRERREFDLEEDLFAKLLFLYRSPETLIKWTRPPEDGGSDEY